MLSEFLLWWGQHLRAALPASLTQSGGRQARGLVVVLGTASTGPASVDVLARRAGREDALGRFTLDPDGIAALRAVKRAQEADAVLRLPPDMLLEQQVVLPIAAERDPERVLQYEMDRITPFAADELFWTWAIERRDRANGRLYVRLSLVPKARLAPLLQSLAAAGLRPAALEAATPDGPARRIALDRVRPARWRAASLATAGAVLAIAAAIIPFVTQSNANARIEARIAALRAQVDQVEALRRKIAGSAAGTDVFAEQRARVGDALGALATLTDVLPDDTVLNELSMRARSVSISGHSAAAARLIPALAAHPAIRNPAFAAPVTRHEAARGEGFSIRAEVVP